MNDTTQGLMNEVLGIAYASTRREITDQLVKMYKSTVQSGPFEGMKLPTEASWGDGDLAPKILGCYEQELHESIEQAIERKPDSVINIGSAEGYYAVGLSRRLPGVPVHAIDTSAGAFAICRLASALNGDAAVQPYFGTGDSGTLARFTAQCKRPLVIIDVEGDEIEILTPETIAGLTQCDLIVECHDFVRRDISAELWSRFSPSHDCEMLGEGARNPNQYPALMRLNSLARWIAVCEGRPEMMNWLVAWARR